MNNVFVFKHECVILDACCILNLYATNRFQDILAAIPIKAMISSYVKDKETLEVITGFQTDGSSLKQPIDLTPSINSQLIHVVSHDAAQLANRMIFFASHGFHNGETISAAIAQENNWAIATDERRVIKVFSKEIPTHQTVSTYDFVKYWAETQSVPRNVLREAVYRIRVYGRFMPAKSHPHYGWIMQLLT